MGNLLSCCGKPHKPKDFTEIPAPTDNPKNQTFETPKPKWQDFVFSKLNNQVKSIGINQIPENMPISIEDCCESEFHIFSTCTQVTIDNLKKCFIYLAPVESSVLIRGCSDCCFVISGTQIRINETQNCDIFLYCNNGQPTMESSHGIRFSSFHYYYPGLSDQFKKYSYDITKNKFNDVFDFNASGGPKNWQIVENTIERRLKLYRSPPKEILEIMDVDTKWETNV